MRETTGAIIVRRVLGVAIAISMAAACSNADPSLNTTTQQPPSTRPTPTATAPPDQGAPPAPTSSLVVATFNVERLFDATCDSNRCGGNNFESAPELADYEARLDQVAEALETLGADIVMVQEIEKEASLRAINERLSVPYPIVAFGETRATASLDVGILARGSQLGLVSHKDMPLRRPDGSPTSFTRDLLELRLRLGDREIVAMTGHFISQRSDDDGRREAEARAAASLARASAQANPAAVVLLGGDFNDQPDSAAIEAMTMDAGLTSLAGDVPVDELWTFQFQTTKSRLDYLMLVPRSGVSLQSIEAVRDPSFRGLGGSDHASLRASLSLAP